MRVLVCDDEPARRDEVVQRIKESGQPDPESITPEFLGAELTALFEEAKRCTRDPASYVPSNGSCFDDVDIVVIDNNLTHLPVAGQLLTAESIAGYVRALTKAVYIIS